MAKEEMNEEEWKAQNIKPEIPLDVQQSIPGYGGEHVEAVEEAPEPDKQ